MKKIAVLLLAGLIMGCSSPVAPKEGYYSSEKLGVTFKFTKGMTKDCEKNVIEKGNSISYVANGNCQSTGTISVFEKAESQTIEDAILNLIKIAGKDPANCKIVKGSTDNGNTEYGVNLADNYVVKFTDDELKQIADADKQAALDKGPFNGEWERGWITAEKTMAICSPIDGPSYYMGTSKTIPNLFWYNESKSKTKFIYTQGSADPTFYDWASVEAL